MKVQEILATKSKDKMGEVKFTKEHEKFLSDLDKKMEQELNVK